jgi:hypothetical protein
MKKILLTAMVFAFAANVSALLLFITFWGCDNSNLGQEDANLIQEAVKEEIHTCIFDDPLTDLLWLKDKIAEIHQLINEGLKPAVKIYQCTYDNGKTGFFEEMGNISFFYDCEGNILCIMGGDAGETCQELGIDFANKKLIWEINESITYPVEIETTNFSLSGYDCWENLGFNIVHVINSEQELRRYFTCKIYVDIDFDKYSLIVVSGEMPSGIDSIATNLEQTSSDEYRLEIDIQLNPAANIIIEPWTVSLLAPKIKEIAAIGLVLNYNYSIYDYPLADTRWKLTKMTIMDDDSYVDIDTVDYSNNTVIYDFIGDNKLIITGYIPDDLSEGEHSYWYKKPNVCPTCLPAPNFQIDDSEPVFCLITGDEMRIGDYKINGKTVRKFFVKQN